MSDLIEISLNFPTFRGILSVSRAPKYLRFTLERAPGKPDRWDALDQLDDTATEKEMLFAAILNGQGTIHIDKTVKGKRVGEWIKTSRYELIDDGPTEDVMRSTERWREWCVDREAKMKAGTV